MRYYLSLLALACMLQAGAQQAFLSEVQLAETRFALLSQIYGLRHGFLNHLDTGAQGINRNGFTRLYDVWSARPEGPGPVLLWEPRAVLVSEDGLLGITDGPYFTKTAPDSALKHSGYFYTIWQRKNTGTPFKIILDIGLRLTEAKAPDASGSGVCHSAVLDVPDPAPFSAFKAVLESFEKGAATASLQQALLTYSNRQSEILISGQGRISREELSSDRLLQQRYTLTATMVKQPAAGICLVYGRLEPHPQSERTSPGHFIHVWTMDRKEPKLASAVYRFE